MDRKEFIKSAGILGSAGMIGTKTNAMGSIFTQKKSGTEDREEWIRIMTKIADPVLQALSENKLKKTMPVETRPDSNNDRRPFTHLEAFGRLMTGIAPWLELGPDNTKEGRIRAKYIDLARKSLANAVNPSAPDFLNYDKHGRQPLVDTAFLAHALIKAPKELWEKSPKEVKQNIIKAFKSSRVIVPYYSNWVLFSAMVEAALLKFGADADLVRIDLALRAVDDWYLGDGIYGDGPVFHWDYYNSYVIQPFLLTITEVMKEHNRQYEKLYERLLHRSQRYGEILERLISPDGTYPAIGRSITYRFGAFQLLSQLAWMQVLPEPLPAQQVRTSLTKVIKKVSGAPGTFDKNGWLNLGLYGHQPHLAEYYISTGSLYLCAAVFLPLGLSSADKFWSAAPEESVEEKIWTGQDMQADHSVDH